MNHKTIRDLINKYYVKAGEVVSFASYSIVSDEDVRLKAIIAYYLYEKARKVHKEGSVGIDEIIDEFINCYGLNGDRNNVPQNKMIWNIIDSNGHVEEEYLDDSIIGNKYQILTGSNRELGIAILRYLARQNGFDIEDFQISIDKSELSSNGISKITIDFTKGPVLKERHKEKSETVRDKGKKKAPRTTVQEQLDLARQRNDATMIKYWEDILEGKKPSFQREIDPPYVRKGVFDDTKRKLETARDRVQKYISEVMAKRNSSQPSKVSETAVEQKAESISYIKEEIEESRKAGDEAKLNFWKNMLSLVSEKEEVNGDTIKEEKAEPIQPEKEVSSVTSSEPKDDKLEYAKEQLRIAIADNNQAEIDFWTTMIKFDSPKTTIEETTKGEDISYIENQMRSAEAIGDEVGANYWRKLLSQMSETEEPKEINDTSSKLDQAKIAYATAQLDLAKRAHDDVMVAYWESTLMSMKLDETKNNDGPKTM